MKKRWLVSSTSCRISRIKTNIRLEGTICRVGPVKNFSQKQLTRTARAVLLQQSGRDSFAVAKTFCYNRELARTDAFAHQLTLSAGERDQSQRHSCSQEQHDPLNWPLSQESSDERSLDSHSLDSSNDGDSSSRPVSFMALDRKFRPRLLTTFVSTRSTSFVPFVVEFWSRMATQLVLWCVNKGTYGPLTICTITWR